MISIQRDGKDAKAYQIMQFIPIVERFNLKMEANMIDYHINIFLAKMTIGISPSDLSSELIQTVT